MSDVDKSRYINLETGLGRVRGNKKIYAKMLGLFLKSDEFTKLEESLAAGNLEQAGEVAHAIKGMTGNLALDALFEVSTTLMDQLREGTRDEGTIEELFATYKTTKQVVEEEMAAMEAEG